MIAIRALFNHGEQCYSPAIFLRAAPWLLIFCILAGCSSMVQKGGELLEGSAFDEMELARYGTKGKRKEKKIELTELRGKDGNLVMQVTNSEWPGLMLRGGQSGGSGGFELFQAHILSPHTQGWNEFTLDIIGKAEFSNPMRTGGTLYTRGPAERVQISSGKTRLKSSRFTGDAALTRLRNRRERILALTEWMDEQTVFAAHDSDNAGTQDVPGRVFTSQKDFEAYWKPKLLPELVSRKKRPPEYSDENADWEKADSVKWNRTYSEFLFPDEMPGADQLRELRNSGALLRDWEEALSWIYLEYSWDYVISTFNNIDLQKIK